MKLKLVERKTEVPGVESFIFEPQEPLTWKAGQYLHYVLHHEPTDDRGSDRWFTVASAPFEKRVMITTRLDPDRSSSFKTKLQSLAIGKNIEISHLEGDFTIEDPDAEYIFLAGGIGVTPFHSILKQADHDGVQLHATLLYANRDEQFPYKEAFDAFAAHNPNLTVHYLPGKRFDEQLIRDFIPGLAKPLIYLSGPEPMVDAVGDMLKEMGVPEEHLKQDWFPGYKAE